MSATVIKFPRDPSRVRACMEAVRARADALDVSSDALRRSLGVLFRELQAGRSAASAVALANSALLPRRYDVHGPTPPSAA